MKKREPKEFLHDMAYMKEDIWEEGEIEKIFGHDPATYPDQDFVKHYPEVQFNEDLAAKYGHLPPTQAEPPKEEDCECEKEETDSAEQ